MDNFLKKFMCFNLWAWGRRERTYGMQTEESLFVVLNKPSVNGS